jgi:hypothetical protein
MVQPTTHSPEFYIDAHPEPERENPVTLDAISTAYYSGQITTLEMQRRVLETMPVKACPHGHGYYKGRSCPECKRLENQRPSRNQRGYGKQHKQERERWQRILMGPSVVYCSRCRQPVKWNEEWDLDHTDDRSSYRGPSHSTCNRARLEA